MEGQEHIVHEDYESENLSNDIALIKVDEIPFSDLVQPICVGSPSLYLIHSNFTGKLIGSNSLIKVIINNNYSCWFWFNESKARSTS